MLSDRKANTKTMDIEANDNNAKHDDRSTKSTRKRRRRHSSTDEENFDTSIDVKLKQSALRNNLTPQNVKNILQKVVRNDHVLAIVKLKEEELERREQTMRESKAANAMSNEELGVTENDDGDELENAVPKLTRAKAKALNQYPLPVAPFKHSKPDSEVVALIREELHSDDDDEEYQPGEDDIESDDDINTTTSDIDSQPATPSGQADASEETQTTIYTPDGLFKLPRMRNDSTTSQCEQEYIIAQRTRSKISLAETPIEAIESTFKAPDAPMDMYQMDIDLDPDWRDFLKDFSCPLNTTEQATEMDEDTDPEYCPKLDNQPDDREEFQSVNVSKKEVNDLLNDWYSCVDVNFWDTLTLDTSSSKHPPTSTTTAIDDLNKSLVTPIKQIDEPLTTPDPNKTQKQSNTPVSIESPITSNTEITYFDPSVMSTPAKLNYNNDAISPVHRTQQSFDSFNSTLLSVNDTMTHCTSYPYSFTPQPVFVPVMTFTTNSNASSDQLAIPYNSILVTIPPEATATTPAMPPTVISSIQSSNDSNQILGLSQKIEAGPPNKKLGCRAKRSRFKSALYRELENLDPNAVVQKSYFPTNERGFTEEQRLILEGQLRTHVQLSTQSYLQTYGHPEFYPDAQIFKGFLVELMGIVDKSPSVSIYNIKPAMELITSWENELSQNTTDNTELFRYLQEEMGKLRRNVGYTMRFHDRILRVICESKVFIYPELLPAIPFRFKTTKPSEYFPAEDYLLAFLLEHYFEELRGKNQNYKFAKPKEVTLTSVSHNISAHLNYLRHWKSIYDYIRLRRDCNLMNPIKFYFKHKRAPPIHHRYEVFNPNLVIEPAKQPLTMLSTQWARYVGKLIGEYDEISRKVVASPSIGRPNPLKSEKVTKKITANNKNALAVKNAHDNSCLIQVKILYDHDDSNHGYKCDIDDNSERLVKGQTLLTSYFYPLQKTTNDLNNDEVSIDVEKHSDSTINDITKTEKRYPLWNRRIQRKYRNLKISKYFIRQRIQQFLIQLISKARKKFSPRWYRFQRNNNLSVVYRCIITYHLFTTEFINQRKSNISTVAAKMTTEAIVTNRRVQKFSSDCASSHEEPTAMHIVSQSDVGAKRLPKNQRTNDSTRLLLLSEHTQESSEKDFLFAQRFLDRVEETFINENKHHKFTEFLAILRNFSKNQQQQTGADLYLTLEKFLIPDYPELMELFLSFLLPSDAIEINKSMDYFLKVNSTKFLNKLNIFFQKQPAQIRKVLACLKELSDDPDVTIERIRSKILPLLKGNQLLIDWFIQCVAPEKCESSKDEYETLVLRKGNECFDDDHFEYIPQSEIIADPNENPCPFHWKHGELSYGNRFPLPAKLSFSAIPCSSDAVDSHELETHLLLGGEDRRLHYHCIHNIKEFADSKMRDRHHSELENIGNSGTAEDILDNSDDEQQYSIAVDKIDEKSSVEEISEHGANATSMSDHMLCDNTLLRAHSIRLYPNVDILNKLKSSDQLSGDVFINKELRLSPKKQAAAKNSTNIQLTKPSNVRKTNSPNAKKVALGGCKSPNNKKTIFPPSSILLETTECGQSTSQAFQQESNAIQTAKKLKRILESNDQIASSSLPHPTDDTSKRTTNNIVMGNKIKSQKSHMLSKPIKKQKRAHEYFDSGDEAETQNDSQKIDTPTEIQWTREEDRLLLEQIKAGLDSNEDSINGFADRFPNKSQDQIRDRIDFLIDFLTKLRNKNN